MIVDALLSIFAHRKHSSKPPHSWPRQILIAVLFIVNTHFILRDPLGGTRWLARWTTNKPCPGLGGGADTVRQQFVVVLDAGSTGSRLHVYRFKTRGHKVDSVEDELFAKVKPGLSDYANSPQMAADSLLPLLEKARSAVPQALHKYTPIVLRATAGLRLLRDSESKAILDSVKGVIQGTPFNVGPIANAAQAGVDDAVSIMDGAEEGLLAWMTVMFLQRQPATPIVLELGGGSAQIVFRVDSLPRDKALREAYYSKESVAGKEHLLYRNSYLGYGLMEARRHLLSRHVVSSSGARSHHCLPRGFTTLVKTNASSEQVTVHGSSGDWEACQEAIRTALFPRSGCSFASGCSFNGIHQPSIQGSEPVVAFSYFNDRLGPLNLTRDFTTDDIKNAGRSICSKPHLQHDPVVGPNPFYCLDIAYIYSLLVHGYNLRPSNTISCLKKIGGFEAGWALGSALQVLSRSQLGRCPQL